jgi:ABC-type multidrug transport system ATPase subunit
VTGGVIRAERLTRRFGDLVAVRDLSFDVPKASIFGLLGPNGSGKSTIIRMLCGVLQPSAGTGSVLGVDIVRDPETVKRSIGYMSQRFSLYSDLTCIENLLFYGRIYGLNAQRLRQRQEAVTEIAGIREHLHRPAGHLSGGWKQRLALACALIHEPQVLFLDEPTAGIDPVARRELWDLLFTLSGSGVTMFVTTHYMDEAERCTSVGYIFLSHLIAMGRPEELKRAPQVTPAGTKRYEVICGSPTAAIRRSRDVPEVRDATLFGDRLHILIEDRLPPQQLVARIAPGDAAVSFHEVAPTLEDVFVTLTRARRAEVEG